MLPSFISNFYYIRHLFAKSINFTSILLFDLNSTQAFRKCFHYLKLECLRRNYFIDSESFPRLVLFSSLYHQNFLLMMNLMSNFSRNAFLGFFVGWFNHYLIFYFLFSYMSLLSIFGL